MIVKLEYLKHTGKYYGDGEIDVPEGMQMYDIFKLVRKQQRRNDLPGVRKPEQFYILVTVPKHPHNYPGLILPRKIETFIRNPLIADSFLGL